MNGKTNVAYTRLKVIAKQRSALQSMSLSPGVKLICYFQYCIIASCSEINLPKMAVGNLAFYYTLLSMAVYGICILESGMMFSAVKHSFEVFRCLAIQDYLYLKS